MRHRPSRPCRVLTTIAFTWQFGVVSRQWHLPYIHSQLSAMDVSVRSTMKGAAKCDKHCELQNSVNRQGLERILCFWDIPESMPASVSMLYCSSSSALLRACCCDFLCLRMCAGIPEASDLQLLCCSNQIIKYFRVQITGCSAVSALRRPACFASSQDMKLGQQTR